MGSRQADGSRTYLWAISTRFEIRQNCTTFIYIYLVALCSSKHHCWHSCGQQEDLFFLLISSESLAALNCSLQGNLWRAWIWRKTNKNLEPLDEPGNPAGKHPHQLLCKEVELSNQHQVWVMKKQWSLQTAAPHRLWQPFCCNRHEKTVPTEIAFLNILVKQELFFSCRLLLF